MSIVMTPLEMTTMGMIAMMALAESVEKAPTEEMMKMMTLEGGGNNDNGGSIAKGYKAGDNDNDGSRLNGSKGRDIDGNDGDCRTKLRGWRR
jgi:hypothetical protein